jgi:hypothetical protein
MCAMVLLSTKYVKKMKSISGDGPKPGWGPNFEAIPELHTISTEWHKWLNGVARQKDMAYARTRHELMSKLIFLSMCGTLEPNLIFNLTVNEQVFILYHPLINEELPGDEDEDSSKKKGSGRQSIKNYIDKEFVHGKLEDNTYHLPYGLMNRMGGISAITRAEERTAYFPTSFKKYVVKKPLIHKSASTKPVVTTKKKVQRKRSQVKEIIIESESLDSDKDDDDSYEIPTTKKAKVMVAYNDQDTDKDDKEPYTIPRKGKTKKAVPVPDEYEEEESDDSEDSD